MKHTKPWQFTQWSATVKGLAETCDGFAQRYEDKEAQLKEKWVVDMGEAFSTLSKTPNSEKLAKARESSEASRDEKASKRKCLLVDALVKTPEQKKTTPPDNIAEDVIKSDEADEVLFDELVSTNGWGNWCESMRAAWGFGMS